MEAAEANSQDGQPFQLTQEVEAIMEEQALESRAMPPLEAPQNRQEDLLQDAAAEEIETANFLRVVEEWSETREAGLAARASQSTSVLQRWFVIAGQVFPKISVPPVYRWHGTVPQNILPLPIEYQPSEDARTPSRLRQSEITSPPTSSASPPEPAAAAPPGSRKRRRLRKKSTPEPQPEPEVSPSVDSSPDKDCEAIIPIEVTVKLNGRGVSARDRFCEWFLSQLHPHEKNEPEGNWTWARNTAWRHMPPGLKRQWDSTPTGATQVTFNRVSLEDARQWVRKALGQECPRNSKVPERKDEFVKDHQAGFKGGMLTWNGRWGWDVPEVSAIMRQSLPVDDMVQLILASPFYQELWKSFTTWFQALMKRCQWPQWSVKMEVTTQRKDKENLVHFHAALTDEERHHKKRELSFWEFAGAKPQLHVLNARGLRQAEKARVRLHYYCQAPKIGSILSETNMELFSRHVVPPQIIYQLWQQRKMYAEACKSELHRSRAFNFESFMRAVENWERVEREAQMRERRRQLLDTIPKLPFKVYDEVESFKKQFEPEERCRLTRFKFLVLDGPSRMGKTRFAESLFGPSNTLVISCQGVKSPMLKEFDPVRHQCIVFDEADAGMVHDNKIVFQAGYDEITLGQSSCQQHAYKVWLHGIALVVSTNAWQDDVKLLESQKAWLNSNSFVLKVEEEMWIKPSSSS